MTLISQDLSEFALHARAILGLPIPVIRQRGPSASCALLVDGDSSNMRFENVERALAEPDTALRLFGKPEVRGHRRMGVSLALGETIDEARAKARTMTETLLEGVKCDDRYANPDGVRVLVSRYSRTAQILPSLNSMMK